MARSYVRTDYKPVSPEKYIGNYPITLKSSWELEFAVRVCDLNDSCLKWAYEPWQIPYPNPLTGKQSIYLPDFLVTYATTGGNIQTVLIEIKPLHEDAFRESYARNKQDVLIQAKNLAKWKAAMEWCIRRGIRFQILTEAELFAGGDKIQPPKRRIKRK